MNARPQTVSATYLNPQTMSVLQDAFDGAWSELRNRGLDGPDDEQSARDLIAKRIVKAAFEGERDPLRLSRYALKAFSTAA